MSDPDFLFGPTPHQEAVDFIKSKPAVSRDVFNGLLPELKARAFTVTGVEGANVLQAVRDRIADLPAGHNWDDIKKDIVGDISPFIVDPNASPEHRDGQIHAANRRAELLLRTHGFQAYQAASYDVMDRQRDVLPFWQYLTMEDDRVRDEHAALDKIVLPSDSSFWQGHYPPWDFGCRCQVVAISQEDRDDLKDQEKKKAPDCQLVLEGPQAQHLVHGQLIRGGRSFDVRTPREKKGSDAFGWHPGDLRLSISHLRGRYDAATFADFESWARRMPLEQGAAKSVWEWLGGAPAGIVPPPLPTLADQVTQAAALPGKLTPAEAGTFIDSLVQKHAVKVADKTTVHVEAGLDPGWGAYAEYEIDRLFSIVPKKVLDGLPKFETHIVADLPDGSLGLYNKGTKTLTLNAAKLNGNAGLISETIFHELTHWVHLHGPQSYRDAITTHFTSRTMGEKTGQLPNYAPGTRGKKDKWWDSYMGREYTGIPDGCEIPTTAFELLTNPAKFSTYWNIPLHQETIREALAILFP